MALSTLTKRSQIWSIDLMIAAVIFLTALLFFFRYSINNINPENREIDNLLLESKLISSYLVSEGYPPGWTAGDVTLIGLTDGNMELDPDKVESFKALSYPESRKLLSTAHDYYVFFEDKDNNTISIKGVEWIGKDYTAEDPDNVIKIVRFVNYNSTIIKMMVYVW
ncbi:hypothetical protein KY366_05725 [Candidatus Woesearchaeota archaeon]|nr:hypothetical protein [Candidatus Woesearchaeota archaeon]